MTDEECWRERACICEFVSIAFSCPDDLLVRALTSGDFASASEEIADLIGVCPDPDDRVALAAYAGRDADSTLHELRTEYTRLFVGAPRPLVSPYEGVWRSRADGIAEPLLMVNEYAESTRDFFSLHGVKAAGDRNIPLDHFALEAVFLGYVASVAAGFIEPPKSFDARSSYLRFSHEHLHPWVSDFCRATAAQTRLPFYRISAQIAEGALS